MFREALTATRPTGKMRLPGNRRIDGAVMMLVAITAGGAALRLYNLDAKSLWYDEAVVWLAAQATSLREVVAANARMGLAAPLASLMLHVVGFFGQSEVALRALPVAAGVASIPAIYVLSLTLNPSRAAACVAAALVAVSRTQVQYSQTAREYSFVVLLTIATLWLLARWLTAPRGTALLMLVAVQMLDLITHHGLALLVAACSITSVCYFVVGAERSSRKVLAMWVAGQVALLVVGGLVYALSLRYQIANVFAAMGRPTSVGTAFWQGSIPALVTSWRLVEYAAPYRSGVIAALVLVFGGLVAVRSPRRALIVPLLTLPFIVTIAGAMMGAYPYAAARYGIFLTVAIYLLLAWGVVHLANAARHRVAVTLVLAVLALGNFIAPGLAASRQQLEAPGWEQSRDVVETLRREVRTDDTVFVLYDAIPAFLYYWCRFGGCQTSLIAEGQLVTAGSDARAGIDPTIVLGELGRWDSRVDRRLSGEQVQAALGRRARTWLFFAHSGDADTREILAIASHFGTVAERQRENGVVLYVMSPRAF